MPDARLDHTAGRREIAGSWIINLRIRNSPGVAGRSAAQENSPIIEQASIVIETSGGHGPGGG